MVVNMNNTFKHGICIARIAEDKRVMGWSMFDPFKRFYVKNYEFCLDRRAAEKDLLTEFNLHLAEGEWIKHHNSIKVIKHLRKY